MKPTLSLIKSIVMTPSILIVDDNQYAAQALGRLLEHNGSKVELAYDGESALRIASASHLDAIVLDIGLPGKDGYEIAYFLKYKMRSPALLIALTGHGQGDDKRRARQAGFDHHLVKPVLSAEIEKLVSAHIAKVEKTRKG
jgi:DNA-binding response OmpR family regulator